MPPGCFVPSYLSTFLYHNITTSKESERNEAKINNGTRLAIFFSFVPVLRSLILIPIAEYYI